MKNIATLFFFLCLTSLVKAQTTPTLQGTLESLAEYHAQLPREKVYLHIDKPYYSIGDQIWFKGYITIGGYNNLSSLSKILYVDLVNVENEVVLSRRLPVVAGITFGDFLLTDSLESGDYRIRAYTNWMRNFDEHYAFDREFKIGNAFAFPTTNAVSKGKKQKGNRNKKADSNSQPDEPITFFLENPDGLVGGLLNRLVFKITEPHTLSDEPKGLLIEGESHEILNFQLPPTGIGSFSFVPSVGQTYKVKLMLKDGGAQEVNLPEVKPRGYTLETNTWTAENVFIQIAQPSGAPTAELALILQKAGEVFYASQIKPTSHQTTIAIPKSNLPAGVVEVLLYSKSMEQLGKKNIFIHNDSRKLPLTVTTNRTEYSARERVQVSLKSGHASEDSLKAGSFSVAVIDLNKVPHDSSKQSSIVSYLTLKSESSAPVHSPIQYFQTEDIGTKSQLDNLVQTFTPDNSWKNQDQEVKYRPEQNLRISGQVTKRNGQPAPFAQVMIMSPGSLLIDTVADENGKFNFDQLLFYDNTKFVVQARDEKGKKNVEILLDEVPRQHVSVNKDASSVKLDVDTALEHYLKSSRERFDNLIKNGKMDNSILLDNVDIVVEKKNPAEHSSNLNGAGQADQVLGEDDLRACSNLQICLQGRLAGVIFQQGQPYSTRSPNRPMQVILDGMYVEGEILSMIPPMDVASVEVLRTIGNTAVYGSMGGGGVLIITTKRGGGNYSSNLYTPGIVTYSPQGFYEISEFTSPDYSQDSMNIHEPDLRSTIYWNPMITTDDNGDATFHFYTADQSGRYLIVVEGIDLNGRLGRAETHIEVKGK